MAPLSARRPHFRPAFEVLEERNLLAANLTAQEQLLLELINRGRADPSAEAARLNIGLNEGLPAGTISAAAKQPLAANQLLVNAMRSHLTYLQTAGLPNIISHTGSGGSSFTDRMTVAGYTGATTVGENLAASWTTASLNLTAETVRMYQNLFIDANVTGRGHRLNLLAGSFKEVGPGVVGGPYTYQGTPGNAALSGQDFGARPGNSFLTGVLFTDAVANDDFYTVGEGMGGVTVRATRLSDGAQFTDVSGAAGGYAIQLAAGIYNVTASGPGITGTAFLGQINIAASNLKLDYAADSVPLPNQTVGVYNPSTATWYLRNSNGSGSPSMAPFSYGFGSNPVTGDWNGDGTDTVGVFFAGTATWYLRNSNSPGAPDAGQFQYGGGGWIPVVGDWDGDGDTTVGVVDPRTMTWYLKNSNSSGSPSVSAFQYGAPGWIPVVGDWDGNGTTTIGVVDPSTMTWYLKNSIGAGSPSVTPFSYGAPGWIPVVGDWDGNGSTTIGVYAPATAAWYLRNSTGPGGPHVGPFSYGFGSNPVAGNWDFLAPLLADGPGSGGVTPLQQSAVDQMHSAALALLTSGGADAALLARLGSIQFVVASFDGVILGQAQHHCILLDADAAGHGWFIDATPLDDTEFTDGTAGPGSAAAGRIDLLTVVLHELGHVAGIEHGDGLMGQALAPGQRSLDALDAFFGLH